MSVDDEEDAGISAFRRLDAARSEIRQYLPEDFDPEKELEEARMEKYVRAFLRNRFGRDALFGTVLSKALIKLLQPEM